MSVWWSAYDRWDHALGEVVYGEHSAHQPVFLDVEDDLLVEVAKHQGLDLTAAEAEQELAAVVRGTLWLGPSYVGKGPLQAHRNRLNEWTRERRHATRGRSIPPPVLALLAIFARAAELMGRDQDYSSAAYFPRLHQLLGITSADEVRFNAAYRANVERFWSALNQWLDGMDGAYGLPTAESIGHRYVGIAMSQALIREADRQLLQEFFAAADLEPGLQLTAEDMANYLDSWVKAGNGSASMKSLLGNRAGRTLLSEAAAKTLVDWDGIVTGKQGVGQPSRPPRLTARVVRPTIGPVGLRLGFALRGSIRSNSRLAREWIVESAPSHPKPRFEFEAISDNLMAPLESVAVDGASLLTGNLRLVPADGGSPVIRKAQPLVVLSYSGETAMYVEVDRVRLFEPHMLIVNGSATRPNGKPVFSVDDLLMEIARPGFRRLSSVSGIPDGWLVYQDVVIMQRHERSEFELDTLKPAQTSTLNVLGGFRLPGHYIRWHSDVALDINATAVSARELRVTLSRLDDDSEEEIVSWTTDEQQFTRTTDSLHLTPGRYRCELHAEGLKKRDSSTSTVSFELVASDTPRIHRDVQPLGYPLESPPGAVSARHLEPPADDVSSRGVVVRGGLVSGASDRTLARARCEGVWWKPQSGAPEQVVLAEAAPPDSCAIRGNHVEHIETHHKGMKFDRGECIHCGRVKHYPPRGRLKQDRIPLQQKPLKEMFAHIGAVAGQRAISGESLLDTLVWASNGTPNEVLHLVRQVDDSAFTVNEVLRALESLAHIDLARDPETLRISEWAMAPRSLLGLEDGCWLVAGGWNRSSLRLLEQRTQGAGGHFEVDQRGWLPRRCVSGLDRRDLASISIELGASVAPNAGRRILQCLPKLSELGNHLPRVSIHGLFNAEWFNPASTTWVPVQSVAQPGAYRSRGSFTRNYYFRSASDVGEGTAVRGTPELVKHLASLSRPLIGYEEGNQHLVVPLGASLPGLYGRAVTLLSGRLPSLVAGRLVYEQVSLGVAEAVVSLFKEEE